MKKISEVTRRNIFDMFETGIVLDGGLSSSNQTGKEEILRMSLYGRLDEISFLERIFPLDRLCSHDPRYKTAREDIFQHTIRNDDWRPDWLLTDDRFNLVGCEDEVFLEFICSIFHPAIRKSAEPWEVFLRKINEYLYMDGYKLIVQQQISGHEVFSWMPIALGQDYREESLLRIAGFLDSEYVRNQISMMEGSVETNPYIAIGKAKELIETTCKSLLDIFNTNYTDKTDLPKLFNITCEQLGLSSKKDSLKPDTRANIISRNILGSNVNIVINMAELRNRFGDGHGRPNTFLHLPSRYARLAVGSAITVVEFMISTYEQMYGVKYSK